MIEGQDRAQTVLRGTPASPGLATGRLLVMDPPRPTGVVESTDLPDVERSRLQRALGAATADLEAILAESTDEEASGMVEFQLAMLEDDSLTGPAFAAIDGGASSSRAWTDTLDTELETYLSADDEYFQARSIDVRDIRDRVLDKLQDTQGIPVPAGAIVMGDDLSPSRFLEHRQRIAGIALQDGSSSSHVAILARAQATPMLVQVEEADVASGVEALLDARNGTLTLCPDRDAREAFEAFEVDAEREQRATEVYLHQEARLPGGERVLVHLNVADPDELLDLPATVCDGIGLVRTEFLFQGRNELPDEDEQFQVYRRLVEWAGGRPVTFRTLDGGGDKPIPGLTPVGELNPFLGVRGLRLSLRRPDVFEVQLRALARTASLGPVKVMLPMVTDPSELDEARVFARRAVAGLSGGAENLLPFELGIMVEVPSCALSLERFDADFYSIGSNDLLQYLTACGRENGELEPLARADNPALLSLIESVVSKGSNAGKPVSLCGDMAGDPRYLPLLLERGLRSVSVSPAAVARTKATVATQGAPHRE